MNKRQLLKRRALQLVLIAAWIALGTVMVVLRPRLWVWFTAVCFIIAVVYLVAEVLTWRYVLRAAGAAGKKDQPPLSPEDDSGPSD